MSNQITTFADINELVTNFRTTFERQKYILLFAYNGTGKTRLSMAFKEAGKQEGQGDTLYFNAFTEDLFYWDNDLENDTERVMHLNTKSKFFAGLEELEMENRIRPFLHRYADFDFSIDTEKWTINFFRSLREENTEGLMETIKIDFIKVSRGEENLFIWCFFLAIAQLAIDEQGAYNWVKYLYIDDPISSLDDNNAIMVASHLAQILKKPENKVKTVLSSHHTLFFNVMCNELGRTKVDKYFLSKAEDNKYILRDTTPTPFFHHVAMLKELHKVAETGEIYTYHFNILRNILEKTATFHGFKHFSTCIKEDENDIDGMIHKRMIDLLSHGNYSHFDPMEMVQENKDHFRQILNNFMENYRFNPDLFPEEVIPESQP